MSESFFSEIAKTKIVEAVRAVESQSSAEIVVSVRGRSDDYREVDLTIGMILAIVTLVVLIYIPAELDEDLMPIETLAAFVLGSILVNKVSALKRVFVSRKRADSRITTMARSHFVTGGVSRTKGRSGILVYVSELERRVHVVPDVGIDVMKLGDGWAKALVDLEGSATTLDVSTFTRALTALGPVLATVHPRGEDDENELPDAPMVLA